MKKPGDWVEFKKTFGQDQEDALWQYFIDHANASRKNGFFSIQFYVRDIDDFWKRVFARYNGDFTRYDKLQKEHERHNIGWIIAQKKQKHVDEVIKKIKGGKNIFMKLLLWINRKTKRFLFD